MLDTSFVEQVSGQTRSSFFVQQYDSVSYNDKLKLSALFDIDSNTGNTTTAKNANTITADSTYTDIPIQVIPINKQLSICIHLVVI